MQHENASSSLNTSAQLISPAVFVNGQAVHVVDSTPTPRQVLQSAGYGPALEYVFIRLPAYGPTDSLALDEPFVLYPGRNEFFAFEEDGVFFLSINDVRYEWKKEISVSELRRIGRVPEDHDIFREEKAEKDRVLEDGERIDLGKSGVERFYTSKRQWDLDVQGDIIHSELPNISVREALTRAGFDTTKSWIITLKIKGEPKHLVDLDYVIDLTRPGIERLRVLKGQVTNGETAVRRDFNLLPKDHAYLDRQGLRWETVVDNGRWLLVDSYPLPTGYNRGSCSIAVAIPENYPGAQLDMFFCEPFLTRADGQSIPQADVSQQIDNRVFQRWSRHPTAPWQPDEDSIRTHMALLDESILREVE